MLRLFSRDCQEIDTLFFIHHLKDIKLEVIGRLIAGPEDGMVGGLGPVFHLAQPLGHAGGRLPMVCVKSSWIHKVGTGTGGQITAVPHQLHAPQVDVPVTSDCIFDGIPALGKGRRVQDHHIKLPPWRSSSGQQVENIGALELHPVREAVKRGVFPGLIDGQLGGIHAKNRWQLLQYRHLRQRSRYG